MMRAVTNQAILGDTCQAESLTRPFALLGVLKEHGFVEEVPCCPFTPQLATQLAILNAETANFSSCL